TNIRVESGLGIAGEVDGEQVLLGTEALLAEYGIIHDERRKAEMQHLQAQGAIVVLVAWGNTVQGALVVIDQVRNEAREIFHTLHAWNIGTVLLTGDTAHAAQAFASKLGICHVIAEVLPHNKADIIHQLQSKGHIVAMVGDGINDAPALAQADVGIAMGTGTDVAVEAASVMLVRSDLRAVAHTILLSRRTIRTIRQNLFWAFVYNSVGIPIAALGMLNPMVAAAAMAMSSVSVLTNSLRLRYLQFPKDLVTQKEQSCENNMRS
ncbi:MAG: HAD-IC family P-type ATPase, partial [Bacteroidota bacterium]|nr:HAD-IC family P-type ATPase [Candidatus Kapabacteria bacterium]MDW8221301.1 HAD-IC family P-type ATPase [Bacteroidota bacterium]